MAQHNDPRLMPGTSQQFPPPGFEAQPVGPAAEHPDWAAHRQQELGTGAPMAEEGTAQYTDYFGFSKTHRYMMPDGRQWIEFKTLAEGDLALHQQILNRDITVEKNTGNARIKINQVEERHALLQVAVVGWHMVRWNDRASRFEEVPFSKGSKGSTLTQWIQAADPNIVADLDETIRKINPTLLAANNETLEAIDKQIADLEEQKQRIIERMQGNSSSATS